MRTKEDTINKIREAATKEFCWEPSEIYYSDGDWIVKFALSDENNIEMLRQWEEIWGYNNEDEKIFVAVTKNGKITFAED